MPALEWRRGSGEGGQSVTKPLWTPAALGAAGISQGSAGKGAAAAPLPAPWPWAGEE